MTYHVVTEAEGIRAFLQFWIAGTVTAVFFTCLAYWIDNKYN